MNKKVIVVGGVAGGASAAARLRRIDESAQITVYEKGPDASYSNCSLPFLLSGIVSDASELVMTTPETFRTRYNLDIRTDHEVLKIDRAAKTVLVKNISSGEEFSDTYDELILSPGAAPLLPRFEGLDEANVFTVKNVADISRLNSYIQDNGIKELIVVGGGFIGLEIAENLCLSGIRVTLVEALNQVMVSFDYDMAQILHKALFDHGIHVILGDALKKLLSDGVILNSGKIVKAPGIVMALGVRPETGLAENAGLATGETGAILVNEAYQTNDPSIYAVGDAIEVRNFISGKAMRLTQAGPAQKEARKAANSIYGFEDTVKAFIGSSVIRIFDWTAASTGLNEKSAAAAEIDYDFVYLIPSDRVGLMPGAEPVHFKLIYEKSTGRILGAQAVSKGVAEKRVDVIAALISMGGTLDDLKNLELCYAPIYGTAKDVVNYAALVALNIKNGVYRQVPVTAVRSLVESGAFLIDVREECEYLEGHVVNAVNIPLSQIRQRSGEVPKDVPVYLYCRTGQRSYNALLALQNVGFENLYNISGSFLGISYFEFFNDVTTNRDRIVTAYNFN